MTIDYSRLAVFDLQPGGHNSPDEGLCAMEAVAWLEGLPHSDRPPCTCPVIGAYVRSLNDSLSHHDRQRLTAYLPRLVGTVSSEHEWPRARYLIGESFSKCWPILLRALNLEVIAVEFEQVGNMWKGADSADLAQLADLAVRAHLAARAARADLAALADLADLAALAARADLAALVSAHFDMLDGVLAIGAPSRGFSHPIEPRINAWAKTDHCVTTARKYDNGDSRGGVMAPGRAKPGSSVITQVCA